MRTKIDMNLTKLILIKTWENGKDFLYKVILLTAVLTSTIQILSEEIYTFEYYLMSLLLPIIVILLVSLIQNIINRKRL